MKATMHSETLYWIERLSLAAHPEGGYYRETYRSGWQLDGTIAEIYHGNRAAATAIYYLLDGSQHSTFHRLKSDEMLHFYAGTILNVYVMNPEGELHIFRLGDRTAQGACFQLLIAAGHWFAAAPEDPQGYALIGCTVAPGFDFKDFETGSRQALLRAYPQHKSWIERLTWDN
jgi:predicted cupin superfamily sugar epimerase